MKVKTCLQFDEPETEDFEFCLNLEDTLIYAEDNFLLSSCEEDFPSFEFPSNVNLIQKITFKNENFLFIVLEDSSTIFIDLKTKKLTSFTNVLPSKIIQIRQFSSSLFLLTESSSIFQIENFILFTRLTQDLLKERYESGQILKEFAFDSKVKDFFILCSSEGISEFLTVGNDQMISWWTFPNQNEHKNSTKSSIINYFSSAFSKQEIADAEKPPKTPLKLVKFLNEPDRSVDKILLVKGNLAVLEDSTHGRLLVLDTDLSLILKIFKGYRNCSVKLIDQKFLIWAGNRFTLETWETFPFCETKLGVEEFPHCKGKFDFETEFFYLYDPELLQLKQMSQ